MQPHSSHLGVHKMANLKLRSGLICYIQKHPLGVAGMLSGHCWLVCEAPGFKEEQGTRLNVRFSYRKDTKDRPKNN